MNWITHNAWITIPFPLSLPLYSQLFEGYDNVKEEVISYRKKERGRIIPGINLLFRDIHSNAADLKSGCSSDYPVTPFHSCATLFPTRLRISLFPAL